MLGYYFDIQKGDAGDSSGTVSVRHYGLQGRICSEGWDDSDAEVCDCFSLIVCILVFST